jgi:hypothetical protein
MANLSIYFWQVKSLNQNLFRLTLLAAAIAATAFGIYRGEVQEVLLKAINLCLECIGIG